MSYSISPEQKAVTSALNAFKGRPCSECGRPSEGVPYFRRAGVVVAVYPSCIVHARAYATDGAAGIPRIYAAELDKWEARIRQKMLAASSKSVN